MTARQRTAVAIGGGTGLPVVLSALLSLDFDVTAVVTMADDGGSSGALRDELGALPPGDARNCLVALADPSSELAPLFQHRFESGGCFDGHALGNFVIAALAETKGGFPEALEAAGRLLGARGRVLPSTTADVVLHALDAEGREVRGQANVARNATPIARVVLEPELPAAHGPALETIRASDVVILGPGSLFTSVIPNLLVEGVQEALAECAGRRVYVCNVANQRGETAGMDARAHVQALMDHGLGAALDAVLVHDCGTGSTPEGVEMVCGDPVTRAHIRGMGPEVFSARLADAAQPLHHDPARLTDALREVLGVVHR